MNKESNQDHDYSGREDDEEEQEEKRFDGNNDEINDYETTNLKRRGNKNLIDDDQKGGNFDDSLHNNGSNKLEMGSPSRCADDEYYAADSDYGGDGGGGAAAVGVDLGEVDADDISEGSFPTTRDLASLAVGPSESGSSFVAMSGGGSDGGGGSGYFVGDTSSAGGMNGEAKLSFTSRQRSLSFSSDHDRPVSGVMITTNTHNHSSMSMRLESEPTIPCYAASETAKSDIATVCSNSVVEDIDIASVGTAHSATTTTMPQHGINQNLSSEKLGRKKHERGVEFSTETSTVWKYRNVGYSTMRSSPTQTSTASPSAANIVALNDMGPPLNRSILERVGGGLAGPSSTSTASRAGSVKSFGSQAASDVVHVDTDDCGGSIFESDGHFSGLDENTSFQSQEYNNLGEKNQQEALGEHYRIASQHNGHTSKTDVAIENNNNVVSLDKLSKTHPNGRVSPGGTVYKGRGVRKYQGRYMHLPLKRFHQNGATIPEPIRHDDNTSRPDYNEWSGRRSWQRSRDRSRSRSRDREVSGEREVSKRWERSKSKSPPIRQSGIHRNEGQDRDFRGNGRSNYGGRWKHGRRNNNSSRRNSWHTGGNWNSHKMTPRDSRHRDLK